VCAPSAQGGHISPPLQEINYLFEGNLVLLHVLKVPSLMGSPFEGRGAGGGQKKIFGSAYHSHSGQGSTGVKNRARKTGVATHTNDHFLADTTKDEKWLVLVGLPPWPPLAGGHGGPPHRDIFI
jgi:hypothetical protein